VISAWSRTRPSTEVRARVASKGRAMVLLPVAVGCGLLPDQDQGGQCGKPTVDAASKNP